MGSNLKTVQRAYGTQYQETITYEYNKLNKVTKITDNASHPTVISYNFNSHIETLTDAELNITRYEYNFNGQVTKITDDLGNITNYGYAPAGGCPYCSESPEYKLKTITDA
ncbi:MAG: hypothetical protein HY880_00875, partial [Deltaproteobacteria bacterium]|nr:hypothetical protein [Deltaproteobacteria bacterium]